MFKRAETLHPQAKVEKLSVQTTPVEISRDVYLSLRGEAAARSTTVPRLINQILEVAVTDRLTGAIIGDR
jgi:hypothetical protein